MTVIRPGGAAAPLDISRLDIGPPLDADEDRTSRRDLVAYRLPDQPVPGEGHHGQGAHQLGAADALLLDAPRKRLSDRRGSAPHVRYMTPRQMLEFSQTLYVAGVITYEDYEVLAFQPDLHPDFNRTIGALTGERAQPDRPRDFLRQWEDRLDFAQRYHPSSATEVRQARRLLSTLKMYQSEADIFPQ